MRSKIGCKMGWATLGTSLSRLTSVSSQIGHSTYQARRTRQRLSCTRTLEPSLIWRLVWCTNWSRSCSCHKREETYRRASPGTVNCTLSHSAWESRHLSYTNRLLWNPLTEKRKSGLHWLEKDSADERKSASHLPDSLTHWHIDSLCTWLTLMAIPCMCSLTRKSFNWLILHFKINLPLGLEKVRFTQQREMQGKNNI